MKKNVRRVILVALLVIFAACCARILFQVYQYQEGDKTYEEAAELVHLPDLSLLPTPTPMPSATPEPSVQPTEEPVESEPVYVDPYAEALQNMDFSALQEVNSDVWGWILIPWTNVSYPLVQSTNNSYYLNHTWRKTYNSVGAIFLECQNSRDLSDFNTIIYGHRMNNYSMFGVLSNYKKQSYWSQHPYIYITDKNGTHKYAIFSAYEGSVEGLTYQVRFSGKQEKQNFIDYCVSKSVISTGITPTVSDRIITLSTCTGFGHATRWVVQGVLVQ